MGDLPGIQFMPEPEGCFSTRWLTLLTIDSSKFGATREDVRLSLEAENIESRPAWKPMHMQPVFKKNKFFGSDVAAGFFKDGLCLPSGTALTESQQQRVIEVIKNCHR